MVWLIKIFRGYILSHAVSMIAEKLRQDKALVYALREYQAGASFFEIARVYAINTEAGGDDRALSSIDQVIAEIKTRPFREVLAGLLRGIKLPDFDGDPQNDINLFEAIDHVVTEAVSR